MKRIISLLCLSAFLLCAVAAYATTSDDTDTDTSSAVVMQDDQADQADDAAVTDEEQAGDELHVKMDADEMESDAAATEDAQDQ